MKAYRLDEFKSPDDLHLRDEDEPHPQRGELLVRVQAVSLNFRDIAIVRDKYALPHKKGLIPTSDAAGEVVEVGDDVDDSRYRISLSNRVYLNAFGTSTARFRFDPPQFRPID